MVAIRHDYMGKLRRMDCKELRTRDKAVVWHPFTQSGMNRDPLVVVGAKGAKLILESGEEILDGISSWWCNIHGHGRVELVEAASKQFSTLDHVLFAGCTHEPAVALAEGLLAASGGGFSKVFYSDNGSTAVEVAIKLGVQFWRNRGSTRTTIVALEDAYHGDTFGAMAAGARGIFSQPFDTMLFRVERLSTNGSLNDLERLEKLCRGETVAACIFEPRVQGAGGMRMYDTTVLDRYIEICRRYGVITIADEVMTGFGRTGPLFASSTLTYSPDMMCLSKALTGGTLPLAVTLCNEEIFQGFVSSDHSRTFFHGHTYTGNPIACAVGCASLRLTQSPQCASDRARIETAHIRCAQVLRDLPGIENVRVAGTILAFDLTTPDDQGYTNSISHRVGSFFRQRGVLLRPLGNVVYCMPPYCTTDEELAIIHDAMRDIVSCL